MSTQEFAIAEVMPGKLNALVKNIMRQTGQSDPNEAVRLVNSGQWVVVSKESQVPTDLHEIRLSVTSDGTTGKAWIKRLGKKGFRVSDCAEELLTSSDFKPTKGVSYEVCVIKGSFWKSDNDRTTVNIHVEATKRTLVTPNAEVACLLREKLTDQEIEAMGLWWLVVMHEPIKDSDGVSSLLALFRFGDGRWLLADCDEPGNQWGEDSGFAFVFPQGA